ncbi:TadE/TadG family type IV pilus assembly protein [Nocardioides bruguierae]|uniref:Pilus assembly protein n=1 Tax=Nocardioides bruguierae TaxID=2945102 RepID=A0A9X2D4Y7_9ACTN|nr:TadE family protein [Nocardioides bruguierae]MCM0619231.1 pilus assembly protein [Nocardioides bruguierae]
MSTEREHTRHGGREGRGRTRQQLRRGRHEERGAAAVEFALVAIILVTLVFGIIQFSLYFWAWQSAGNAARSAARAGAVDPCDTAAVQTAATNALAGTPTDGAPAGVTVTPPSPVEVGSDLTVTITFDALDLGFFPFLDPAIDKSVTTRVEHVPAGGC